MPGSADGLKDLTDHTRTVHFTLLVLCFVLLVSAFADRSGASANAARDWILLRKIAWKDVYHAKVTALSSRPVLQWQNNEGFYRLPVRINGKVFTLAAATWDQNKPFLLGYRDGNTKESVWGYVDSPREAKTVADFVRLWNDAPLMIDFPTFSRTHDEITCTGLDSFTSRFEKENSGFGSLQEGTNSIGVAPLAADEYASELRLEIDPDKRVYRTVLKYKNNDGRVLSECTLGGYGTNNIVADMRHEFAAAADRSAEWGGGTFAEAFPELHDLLNGFGDLSLSQADRYVERQRRLETPPVELFGARLPAPALAGFGATIVVLCQLYLWIHLCELAGALGGTNRSAWPKGYLATYGTGAAFVLATVSSCGFPPLTLLIQVVANARFGHLRQTLVVSGVPAAEASWLHWLLLGVTLAASICLSVLILSHLRRIRFAGLDTAQPATPQTQTPMQ